MAQEQQGSGSVYSAYGLGDLMGNTQVSQALMGGVGVAVAEPYSVSMLNPASYPFLMRPAFEVGMMGRILRFDSDEGGSNGSRSNLLGLSLGVPFGNGRWGIALGLNPVSRVGYDVTDERPIPDGTGEVTLRYSGEGGLNRAFLGLGRVLVHRADSLGNGGRLSIGANINYLFGSVEESRKAIYPGNQGFYNSNASSSLVVRDPTFSAGVQYHNDLVKKGKTEDEGLRFVVGLSAELPAAVSARRTEVVSSFILGGTGVEFPVDTAFFTDGRRGELLLPLQWNVAFGVYDTRWMVTAEYRMRDWDQLRVDVDDFSFRSELGSQRFHGLGASFKPAGDGRGNFWTHTIYRAGLRYVEDYLVVRDRQIREFGMSFGLSVPVMSSTTRSRISLGAELGEYGTTQDGLIRQRFVNIYAGITITPDLREQWFKKRRIE